MAVQFATGSRGIVASGHPLATDAALEVLKKGGNAVDAAICGALALTVTCPYATSLAGDMYMLVYKPGMSSCDVIGLNATGCAPAVATVDQFPDGMPRSGIRAATVPGFLAGAADALDRLGTITLAEAIAPAVELAESGFPVHPYFTKNIVDRRELLAKDPAAGALFLPGGEPLSAGKHFVQADLAATLREVARNGVEGFYRGALGKRIVAAVRKAGGLFDESDFAAHRSLWQTPVSGPFRGHMVWTMPPNSYGATLLLQLIDLEANGITGIDPDGLDFIVEGFAARKKSYAAAAKFIADPELAEEKLAKVLETAIADGRLPALGGTKPAEAQDSSTTNIVVIDKDGMAVSLIESISTPFGAGIVLEGTGIVLNNRIGGFNTDPASINCVAPGKRPAHTLAPCIVTKGARLAMTIGTPGTVGQTCVLAQILSRILACGQTPETAIAAPRWSADFQGKLVVEDTMPAPLRDAAIAAGAQTMPAGWISFGSIKLAMPGGGAFAAYADDRRSASAAGF
jgi:gamma-glutamyltranspeptidase/glutathione hydrolase